MDLRAIHVEKTKSLISCVVTAQLICTLLVFAYADCWVSGAAAQILKEGMKMVNHFELQL